MHAGIDCGRCSLFAAGCALCAGLLAPIDAQAGSGWPKYAPKADARRSDIPATYKWNLGHWFKSPQAWDEARKALGARLKEVEPCKGTLARDAARLGKCLDLVYGLSLEIERLAAWARADYSTDRTRPEAKVRTDQIQALVTRFHGAVAFLEPELLAMDPDVLRSYVGSGGTMAKYAHYVDDLIRRRPHVLTLGQEKILALTGDLRAGPNFMVNALEEDVKFPDVHDEKGAETTLTRSSFPKFRASADRAVRKEAVEAFFKTLRAYGRSFAASLDMAVKGNIMVAKARGYGSAIEASLNRNAIPVSVYDTLVRTTHEYLPKTLHRYIKLRGRLLGYDKVHYYDLYTPLFESASRKVPYPEAVKMVEEATSRLGPDYAKVLKRGLDPKNGWVDVFPNQGKRSGAYCNGVYGAHPIVFLNYMGELEDVFTVIHEFGHALHFHLAFANQEYVNSESPIFLAEIASTFNETMLLDYLLKTAGTKEEKLFLLNKRLENIRTTVFRQVMFAEFERAIYHEVESGGALTAERMAAIYGDLIREYYGPDFAVGADDAMEWAYIPHFYYNFYVYQYATGLMSAIALVDKVKKGEAGAVERYLDFLKAGGSDYPVATLQRAGVDLTRPDAMKATYDLFITTMDEIDRLTAK
ncbi:MAG: oligoendopeptidase F [Deltaproteobacteria bacterium]|nr:oligoendopeptidase F [Deltaproteobacteria bacterium]